MICVRITSLRNSQFQSSLVYLGRDAWLIIPCLSPFPTCSLLSHSHRRAQVSPILKTPPRNLKLWYCSLPIWEWFSKDLPCVALWPYYPLPLKSELSGFHSHHFTQTSLKMGSGLLLAATTSGLSSFHVVSDTTINLSPKLSSGSYHSLPVFSYFNYNVMLYLIAFPLSFCC